MKIYQLSSGNKTHIRSTYINTYRNISTHIHQFSEILIILKGRIDIVINGEAVSIYEHEAVFITPFTPHSYTTKDAEYILFQFSEDLALDFISHEELFTPRSSPCFKVSDRLFNYIVDDIPITEAKRITLAEASMARSVKAIIHAFFEEYFRVVPPNTQSKSRLLIVDFFLYVTKHFTEDITLTGTAKALGYTPKYLSNVINSIENISFSKIVNSFRVTKAKTLLRTTTRKTADIALECGYKNETSFHRSFKNIAGMTATEYRNLPGNPSSMHA